MRFYIFLILLFVSSDSFAQSGRVGSNSPANALPATVNEVSVKQMFDEANVYTKTKFAEYTQNKIPYNEKLRVQTIKEQKQLAAKYAAVSITRANLAGEDFYYLGLLHWIAENFDGTAENLRKFLTIENAAADKAQNSRSILTIIAAKRKNFDEAEKNLAEYIKAAPTKAFDRARMENELAENYRAAQKFPQAIAHTDDFLVAQRAIFFESKSRATDGMLAALMSAFELYRDSGASQDKTDATLEEIRQMSITAVTPASYFYAVDNQIKYQIETHRKPLAFQTFQTALVQVTKDFAQTPPQNYVLERLKRRDTQYRMIGETAPELTDTDQWFPGKSKSMASMRGKVVLIDFWATWCGPCLASFPSLIELQNDFSDKGLVILGLTRFYEAASDIPAQEAAEIQTLKKFRETEKLPYDFIVSKEQTNQLNYGAVALPTTVLIDKKGVIRYLESGTSTSRETEIRKTVEKLLAEK